MEHMITAEDLRKIPKEPCPMCKARIKDWNGSDPECSFPDGGQFNCEGWNCATANAIRDLCGESTDDDRAVGVDFQFCEDQKYVTIKIDHIDMPSGERWMALWVSWYKRRGQTEAMWLLSNYNPPRAPTAAECEAIITALNVSK